MSCYYISAKTIHININQEINQSIIENDNLINDFN